MPEAKSLTIAVRFPTNVAEGWRERCLASLRRVDGTRIVLLTAATAAHDTDLILDWSAQSVDPRWTCGPRLGYWTFVYGEPAERIEPGLREFVTGRRAALVRLVRIVAPSRARVLTEGAVKSVTVSLRATRQRLLEAAIEWPARKLRECLASDRGPDGTEIPVLERGAAGLLALRGLVPLAWVRNVLKRVTQEVTREHWAIGVLPFPVQHVLASFAPSDIRWLPVPRDGILADPFGAVLPDGRLAILAESLSWADERGRIVALEHRADGSVTPALPVLDFTGHASYPQLIEHEGARYCLPEICQQRRVQLFKADPFPERWVPDRVLLEDFAGTDATVCLHERRWWMFAGNHDDQDETKLYVFHAISLFGPWTPHSLNPVKCDLRSARPAGALFRSADELYRPAQDCSTTYGGAIVINRIVKLTPEEFREEAIARLSPQRPGRYPDGLHTLNGVGGMTLVDGKRHEISGASIVAALRTRLRRRKAEKSAGWGRH